ncbi:DUF4349 domain-containing protein [Sinomicrobium soli]|uniref:DUF4349 domain-containing protein n=1 Tax=Sinomicrobium sp. N-1-3-6 TaxID=2219864 RepID=UPI001374E24A|nr:DUF4349 domain-containing protein [Sinomicrobium sp. N-1-3-6]
MKHQLFKFVAIALSLSFTGCTDHAGSTGSGMTESEVSLAPASSSSGENKVEIAERKLIKEGNIEFRTDDLGATREIIYQAADKYNTYIASDQEFNNPGSKRNTLTVRVPADNFDAFLEEITRDVDQLDHKQINVRDVTEEFLDIQARLKTKKELEIRYLELLKQAKNVTEILEIEKQAGILRSEIESVEGRLEYLKNRVSFSTLTISFYETLPGHTGFGHEFRQGFRNGWDNLVWFFVALTNVWPFVLIGVVLFLVIRKWRKRRKAGK